MAPLCLEAWFHCVRVAWDASWNFFIGHIPCKPDVLVTVVINTFHHKAHLFITGLCICAYANKYTHVDIIQVSFIWWQGFKNCICHTWLKKGKIKQPTVPITYATDLGFDTASPSSTRGKKAARMRKQWSYPH